ncbi:hypothetical protein Celaphus_00018793, partial [Cervus elaphus hippelaphus]
MRIRGLPPDTQIFYCARPDQEPFVKIITVEEAKRRKSTCSYYEDEDEAALPILQPHSSLLENMHIEQLARRLPARVQGYPWRLAYSTLEHGTSLKTLYRKSAALDSPLKKILFTLTYVENIGIQPISSAFNLHSSPSWFNSLYR